MQETGRCSSEAAPHWQAMAHVLVAAGRIERSAKHYPEEAVDSWHQAGIGSDPFGYGGGIGPVVGTGLEEGTDLAA